jgi:hypothetical protein
MKKVRVLGLDVHADTIAVAVAESEGNCRRKVFWIDADALPGSLIKAEFHLHTQPDRNSLPVFGRSFELPVPQCLDRLLIQPISHAVGHANIVGAPIRAQYEFHGHGSVFLLLARLVRILRIWSEGCPGRRRTRRRILGSAYLENLRGLGRSCSLILRSHCRRRQNQRPTGDCPEVPHKSKPQSLLHPLTLHNVSPHWMVGAVRVHRAGAAIKPVGNCRHAKAQPPDHKAGPKYSCPGSL